jgi:integrase
MEIKSKVFKRKAGKSRGTWVVRVTYFDEKTGKTRCMERHADRKAEAIDEGDRLASELNRSHGHIHEGERMTFDDLAEICERTFYKPAVIVEGRKISGVRSLEPALSQIKVLRGFFGARPIRSITTENLSDYRAVRLNTPSDRTGKPVKIATVNRELSVMRKMMRFALGKGWILKDIFFNAKVIESSAEIERTRLLTPSEEQRLLEACQGERTVTYIRIWKGRTQTITANVSVENPHLKAMIILAVDSGMRRGEIVKLRWQDIDFGNDLIRIVGTHTKTERERLAPLSARAKLELEKIRLISNGLNPFPVVDIKRSFATAKRIAGMEDLHFHDLRRTAITRWIQNDVPLALAGKIAGHTVLQTTMKHYTSTNADMVREVAEKINASQLRTSAWSADEAIN